MIKVSKISKSIIREGRNKGLSCAALIIDGETGTDMNPSEIIEALLKLNMNRIVVKAIVKDNPELKPILVGLSQKAKNIILNTSGSDMVETLRSIRNLDFLLNLSLPTAEYNELLPNTLGCLKEKDEIKVVIKSLEEYQAARKFFSSKPLFRATVIFSADKDTDKEEQNKIMTEFLNDNSRYLSKYYV